MQASLVAGFLGALSLIATIAVAQEAKTPPSDLPSKALILGVPYVSWNEAAQWRYEHKNIMNPSWVATAKMIRRYWGQEGFRLFSLGDEDYLPEDWKSAKESDSGKSLDDLKAWIARGVPVAVALPFTPHAHPVPVPAMLMLGTGGASVKGVKLPDRGPSSRGLGRWASWQDQLELAPGSSVELRYANIREVFSAAWRVVIGYDDERKVMFLHDPSFGPAGEMSYGEFESNWRLNDFSFIAKPPQGYAEFVAKRRAAEPYPPRTADMQAAVHFVFGYGFSEIGRHAQAEREFEKGLAIPGVGKGYRHMLAYELAHHRRAAGRIEDAIALLRQAIDALPEAPGPYVLLVEIYRANPSLPGAQQAATETESAWKSRFNTREGARTALRAIPADFFLDALGKYRGWACEPDFRGSLC